MMRSVALVYWCGLEGLVEMMVNLMLLYLLLVIHCGLVLPRRIGVLIVGIGWLRTGLR